MSSMSTRREWSEAKQAGSGSFFLPVAALVASTLVFSVGIHVAMPIVVALGAAGIFGSLMYLNTMFWSYLFESQKLREPQRNVPLTRF